MNCSEIIKKLREKKETIFRAQEIKKLKKGLNKKLTREEIKDIKIFFLII